MLKRRFPFGRAETVNTWSGLSVPARVGLVSQKELMALMDAAEREQLGWDANGIVLNNDDLYFLFPYSYESRPIPAWKCRVVALVGGLLPDAGGGKKILYGRLDVSVSRYRSLSTPSRKVERQLLHWLAWKAATSSRSKDK